MPPDLGPKALMTGCSKTAKSFQETLEEMRAPRREGKTAFPTLGMMIKLVGDSVSSSLKTKHRHGTPHALTPETGRKAAKTEGPRQGALLQRRTLIIPKISEVTRPKKNREATQSLMPLRATATRGTLRTRKGTILELARKALKKIREDTPGTCKTLPLKMLAEPTQTRAETTKKSLFKSRATLDRTATRHEALGMARKMAKPADSLLEMPGSPSPMGLEIRPEMFLKINTRETRLKMKAILERLRPKTIANTPETLLRIITNIRETLLKITINIRETLLPTTAKPTPEILPKTTKGTLDLGLKRATITPETLKHLKRLKIILELHLKTIKVITTLLKTTKEVTLPIKVTPLKTIKVTLLKLTKEAILPKTIRTIRETPRKTGIKIDLLKATLPKTIRATLEALKTTRTTQEMHKTIKATHATLPRTIKATQGVALTAKARPGKEATPHLRPTLPRNKGTHLKTLTPDSKTRGTTRTRASRNKAHRKALKTDPLRRSLPSHKASTRRPRQPPLARPLPRTRGPTTSDRPSAPSRTSGGSTNSCKRSRSSGSKGAAPMSTSTTTRQSPPNRRLPTPRPSWAGRRASPRFGRGWRTTCARLAAKLASRSA